MKETNPHHRPETVKIVKQQSVPKPYRPSGNMQMHRGHTIFEANLITKEIIPAKLESVPAAYLPPKKTANIAEIGLSPKTVAKVVENESCVYVSALNLKNAIKFLKNNSDFYTAEPEKLKE